MNFVCRILARNVLHESLKVKLGNLIIGPNTRQLCRAGINKIKDMIRKVGWVPQKGILYVVPCEEHAERCQSSFLDYDFSKVVSKVSVMNSVMYVLNWLRKEHKMKQPKQKKHQQALCDKIVRFWGKWYTKL